MIEVHCNWMFVFSFPMSKHTLFLLLICLLEYLFVEGGKVAHKWARKCVLRKFRVRTNKRFSDNARLRAGRSPVAMHDITDSISTLGIVKNYVVFLRYAIGILVVQHYSLWQKMKLLSSSNRSTQIKCELSTSKSNYDLSQGPAVSDKQTGVMLQKINTRWENIFSSLTNAQ